MMLNMSNKFNNYTRSPATNIMGMNNANNNTAASAVVASSSTSPSSGGFTLTAPNNFSNDSNSSLTSNSGKAERESIHSGQFMVSTFEAEEAQDDLDDSEIKMLDPEDPSLSKADDEPNTCMEVQLYVPRKVAQQDKYGNSESHGLITNHLEIETSLTKLFKCMNLAYSQKLTSPKWNHFKGVRLRWKDKIRLNNVIWRCWHMQFILKRKTPVCQFASPLDVDIHSNPQSVVLEGKYWKRQLAVIKAEYRKWRRNYKSKVSGCLIYDTKSELDFLEWSPLNDRSFMISDDWTSDTLFSAINGPFPFPDSREIARGAGIADFIQPSLGPLQPNLDDIDLTFVELLQNSRLPPVPEEGADEMIKNVDYGFSSIMGTEQIDSSNMMDVSSSNVVQSMPNTNDDTNMLELNTPLNTLQFSDIEQQFDSRGGGGNNVQMLSSVNRTNESANPMQSLVNDDAIMSEPQSTTNSILMQQVNRQQLKHYSNSVSGIVGTTGVGGGSGGGGDSSSNTISSSTGNSMGRQNNNDFPVKKGRISKSSQRPFRREPHNYDKAQPTLHQTTIYQQMLAEQQKNQQMQQHQQHLQHPSLSGNTLQHQATVYQPTQQLQQQQQQQSINNTFTQSPQQYNTNLLNNAGTYGSSTENIANMVSGQLAGPVQGQNINSNNVQGAYGLMTPPQATTQLNANNQPNNSTLQNIKIEVPSSDVLTMFNLSQGSAEGYAPYKPYNHTGNFKKSASTGTYINIRGNTSNNQLYMQQQHDQSSSPGGSGGTMHTQSLPLSLGIHLPGLANALQARPPQLSPPNMQQTSQQRLITPQLNLPPQPTQQQQQQHHQQQQSSSNQAQHLQTLLNSQHQQQQHQHHHHPHPQPQHQISQPIISTNNLVPKEIFRSNSLPLNVSLQKLDTRLTQNDNNFAVPTKYVGKSSKTRSRSNSIHQHMIHSSPSSSSASSSSAMLGNSGSGGLGGSANISGNNSLSLNPQLQAATSDPMLNSTLAQLLTTNSRMSSTLGKQQSVSTSNIASSPNVGMSTITALQMQSTQMNVQNKVSTITGPTTNLYTAAAQHQQQQQQQYHNQQQQQSLSSPSSPTMINTTSPISMQQQQKQHNQSQQQQQQQQKHLQTQHMHLQQQQQQQHPHKSPKKSTSLPAPVAPSMLSSPPTSKMLSYPLTVSSQTGCSTHLSLSPESFHDQDSPLSPTQSLKYPRDSQRRAGHIHAEQKRRYNIKNGFDQLHDLIPQLQQNNAKLSKAAMLQKGAEHIKHLRNERNVLKERMDALRMERDALNNSLTHLHSILPANGAPVTRQGTEHVRQLYEQYVRCRTQDNWKFWILGLILEPLLTSYTSTVSSASLDELRRTAFLWVDQHCSLIDLRPAVSNKLKYLSMKTDILSDPPSTLQEEIAKAVNNTSGQHPNLHGT